MTKFNFKIKNIFQSSILILIIGVFLKVSQALAQDNSKLATQNFKETADNIVNNVLTSAGTLLITAAFIVFFYGVVVFIYGRVTGKGDMNDLKKGREFMM